MNELIEHLIESLREELKEYGELLALLDQQKNLVVQGQSTGLLDTTFALNTQTDNINVARQEREQRRRRVAVQAGLPEESNFALLIPRLSTAYRPLVEALVQENSELRVRVQQRSRQNYILLSRVIELTQRFIKSLVTGGGGTCSEPGRPPASANPQQPLQNALG